MTKVNHNKQSLVKNKDPDALNEWSPFEESKRALIDFNKHQDDEIKPGWVDEKAKRMKEWKQERVERIAKDVAKVEITKCPPRTQYHVPKEKVFKPEQFEKELKALKKQVAEISRNNKAGDPKCSNFKTQRAMSDMCAIYCRVNRKDYTIKQLAMKFEVSKRCVERCVKGITYKHLNARYRPWF